MGLKYLKPGEKLLIKQKIKAPREINKDDLNNLYVQEPNRRFLGIPAMHYLVWFYYKGERNYDQQKFIRKKEEVQRKFDEKIADLPVSKTKKANNLEFKKQKRLRGLESKIEDGNNFMQWGEKLAVLDTSATRLTQERFTGYLSSKGYFKNQVGYRIDTIGSQAEVTYTINPGKAYFIDTIFYDIEDSAVSSLVMAHTNKSLIKRGDRYDQAKFSAERERLDFLLKDFGYFDFSRQYIVFDVDTAFRPNKKVAVEITINDPLRRDHHKKFTITEVNFMTDAGVNKPDKKRAARDHHGIHFMYYEDEYNLRILSQRVFLQPGNIYSRTEALNTQRQLANLDAFKFVSIDYDTTGGKFIANIYTSPLDRYQWSNEAGVNVTQGYPGPFINTSFRKRNVFRGLESIDFSGRFGFEGVASATSDQNVYKSTEAGVNITMTFPQIIFPLSERVKYGLGNNNPKTKLLLGYAYTDRPEYRRSFASLSGTYTLENKRTTQYSFTFANITVIDTLNTSADFREFLREQEEFGNFSLVNSFYPSLVTSMIFGWTWNHNNYGGFDRNAVFIRAQLESGGTIWNIADPSFLSDYELQYFQYLRLGVDIRRNRIIDKNTVVAYRFNAGVAYPYGSNESLPYEKFFFVGGSNSIRAWRPRRLGPGSFKPNLSEDPEANGLFDYNIEKPADILLEASIEMRRKLFGFVDGAVFVDAGNVWTFKPWQKKVDDEVIENGNSEFLWNQFYREIGIGTGFGVRFDFTFLILRFDVGIKVYDPARDEGDRWVLSRMKFFKPFGINREPVIYNVGIGFPF
jgi:outer membrane protein assembly factor BamA